MIGTVPACPDWCALPAGHDFDRDGGGVSRLHRREIATLDTEEGGPGAIRLTVECLESGRHEQAVEQTPPSVCVHARGGDDLTGPEARRFAAALLNAADEWDRVTGS